MAALRKGGSLGQNQDRYLPVANQPLLLAKV
jgi:hypothetical protein